MTKRKRKPPIIIQSVVFEDEEPIAQWVSMTDLDPAAVSAVNDALRGVRAQTDPVRSLARRANVYTTAADHMLEHPTTLRLHETTLIFLNSRVSECQELKIYVDDLARIWWDWHDHKIDHSTTKSRIEGAAYASRETYADWLSGMFEAYGLKGRDARYTVRTYLSSFRRGGLKLRTFDVKLTAARERLERLRRG